MRNQIIILTCLLFFSTSSYAQKILKVDNLNSIPVGNEIGLVRDYTNDELLTFIEVSGWVSFYKENVETVPKVVARLSRQGLGQIFIEAKNTWYTGMSSNSINELRNRIVGKYGYINEANFTKYGILLLALEKIDRSVKYL